jgi:nicotinic acid phosphoribosyltransferase
MAIRDIGGSFTAGPLRLRDAALFTDLYELTMAAAFFRHGVRRDEDPFIRTDMVQYELLPWLPVIGKEELDRLV